MYKEAWEIVRKEWGMHGAYVPFPAEAVKFRDRWSEGAKDEEADDEEEFVGECATCGEEHSLHDDGGGGMLCNECLEQGRAALRAFRLAELAEDEGKPITVLLFGIKGGTKAVETTLGTKAADFMDQLEKLLNFAAEQISCLTERGQQIGLGQAGRKKLKTFKVKDGERLTVRLIMQGG